MILELLGEVSDVILELFKSAYPWPSKGRQGGCF